ncbi:hypothetical protein Btru_068909 [Bulinus truncatus]|nr:hypothetical protein Btru_068909 [Bulinus truncatus]
MEVVGRWTWEVVGRRSSEIVGRGTWRLLEEGHRKLLEKGPLRLLADGHGGCWKRDIGGTDYKPEIICVSFGETMPSGNGLGPHVRDNADGTICVEYEPKKEGRHEVLMSYDGSGVDADILLTMAHRLQSCQTVSWTTAQRMKSDGLLNDSTETQVLRSPFSCVVDKIDNSFITAFGAGLVGGLSGDTESFTVVAKKGTAKEIEVKIDGPAKVDLQRTDNADGSANFSYIPMTPGAYNINIKYHGKPIKGSPFVAKVSGEGRKRSTLSLANSAEYSLKINEPEIVDLVGTIQTPGGQIEPIILKKMDNGELGIAYFTPRQKGEYTVCVFRSEKHITNSPFKIKIGDKEIGHAAGCTVKGAVSEALANKSNEVIIDTTNGGYGGLTVSIEGPHRSDVEVYKIEDRVYTVHYSPHEPGIYILNIRFADEDVPGSPFLVNVGGNPSGRVRETVTKEVEPAPAISVGSTSEFVLKIPGTNPFDMEASMTDPDGISELCEVIDQEDFHYLIKMTPKVNGLHIVSIKHKGMHISGSPFQFSVGQLSHGGPHKVQVGGPGLEKGEVGLQTLYVCWWRKNRFNPYEYHEDKTSSMELPTYKDDYDPSKYWSAINNIKESRHIIAGRELVYENNMKPHNQLNSGLNLNAPVMSFKDEYQGLPHKSKRATDNAARSYRNFRFPHLLPYDHSLVPLKPDISVRRTYINASFIPGYTNNSPSYIAAQSPYDTETVLDFWRLIYQRSIKTIVMITNVIEDEIVKCTQYWPDNLKASYGHFLLHLTEVLEYADYTIRTIEIHCKGDADIKIVKLFEYTSWPDHGVPDDPIPFLDMRRKVRKHHADDVSPVLVHCGTGMGRTGVFIAVDTLIDQYAREGKVEVHNYIKKIRKYRPYMVRTLGQYIFIYESLFEEFHAGQTMVSFDLKDRYHNWTQLNPRTEHSYLRDQFEMLEKFTRGPRREDCRAGLLASNIKKTGI